MGRDRYTGQLISRGKKTVTTFSQKNCVDRGKTVGQQLRELYRKVGGKTAPIGEVGDLQSNTVPEDAYADCLFNDRPWHAFHSLDGELLPPGTKKYIRRYIGGHLIPYNFIYSEADLEATVRRQLFRLSGKPPGSSTTGD